MKLRNLLLAFSFCLLFTSCCEKVYYQVYKTEHPNMTTKGSSVTYENDDCMVLYNLWAAKGNPGFGFYNKTDKDIFIVLPRTFYVLNGVAYDYFKNREFHSSSSVSSSEGKTGMANMNLYGVLSSFMGGYNASVGRSVGYNQTSSFTKNTGTSVKEAPILCIPAKSIKFISEYSVLAYPIRLCGKDQEFPKRQSLPVSYSQEDSPVSFKNKITYSFDPEGKEVREIENEFWVSELTNYRDEEVIKSQFKQECPEDVNEKAFFNKEQMPDRFYNRYLYKKRPTQGKFIKYEIQDDVY